MAVTEVMALDTIRTDRTSLTCTARQAVTRLTVDTIRIRQPALVSEAKPTETLWIYNLIEMLVLRISSKLFS